MKTRRYSVGPYTLSVYIAPPSYRKKDYGERVTVRRLSLPKVDAKLTRHPADGTKVF